MKKTKQSFLTSLVALLLLFSMFVGTTFAWFTDEVISSGNVITTGNLDAEMYWSNTLLDKDSADWKTAKDTAIFTEDVIWEPGHTQVRYVKVENAGSLNFKWKLSIAANGAVTDLAKVIDVYYVDSPAAQITSLDGLTSAGKLNTVLDNNTGVSGELIPGESAIYAIAFHMDKLAGNDYQQMSICDGGFSLTLIAAQGTGESDSFGDDYDVDAAWPQLNLPYYSSTKIDEGKIDSTTNSITEAIPLGSTDDIIYATANPGTKLADGADSLTLSVQKVEDSKAIITLEDGESANPLNVHVEGLASDNQTPILVTLEGALRTGLNSTSVTMYHVENGATVPMTPVSNPTNHNEFSYDPATGDVVLALKSFSEIVPVVDNWNKWKGSFDFSWYNGKSSPYTIENADQLAAFGAIVDGGYHKVNAETEETEWVEVTADNFYNEDTQTKEVVMLKNDINLDGVDAKGNRISFNPIGRGYVNGTTNSGGGTDGQVFEGTFDGQNHTIRNLYQNGWDLGLSYNNLGGGLFASVHNATIQNLTMVNANIVMECVEQGVIAGLAQGNCTFDNINIYGCKVANYQKATGGVVGEVSWGAGDAPEFTHTFSNINIDSSTVIGSLWGDFDAPVGGVIGARWDDSNRTKVVMTDVNVACRLDVYNDVTSAYQWYAYRRAGMLIGNTEEAKTENGRTVATASFLECDNVVVYYGSWVDYHYCEFTNQDDSWQSGYPWVRVESGENCSAYSNPRYGHPDVGGVEIKDTLHTHAGNDEHLVELEFNQLYGGGQGVYGSENHYNNTANDSDATADVKFGNYTVTYVDHGEVFHVEYVTDTAPTIMSENELYNEYGIKAPNGSILTGWMDNHGNTYKKNAGTSITSETILYPVWSEEHFVMCFDVNENLIYSALVTGASDEKLTEYAANVDAALAKIQQEVDNTGKVIVVSWDYSTYDSNGDGKFDVSILKNAKSDIILKPKINLSTTSITLTPYPETGETEYYMVTDVNASDSNISIVIPAHVGTIPVTKVTEGAFDGFNNLHAIKIPNTVTTLDKNMFPGTPTVVIGDRQTVTIYYEGTKDKWDALNKVDGVEEGSWFLDPDEDISWDNSLGTGSRVFFLGEDGKVDISQGYLEVTSISGRSPTDVIWTYYGEGSITQKIKDECTANCNCTEVCKGKKQRPDAVYWEGVTVPAN